MIIVVPCIAGLISFTLIAWLLRSGRANLALDQPNERSLHAQPIPRVGGLGIAAGSVTALAIAGLPVVGFLAAMLACVSFADDRRGLPIGVRFAAHAGASAVFLWVAMPESGSWWWFVSLPLLVWMTNLYNFMDGSDGLAGGMAVFGFGAFAIAAQLSGQGAIALASVGIAAASAAFLVFNFPPARVFMGDAGSIPLGFLAGALGFLGWVRGAWPFWFPVVVFSPFFVDASVTLLRRLFRGERIWEAHRSHYYQRLVRVGWGHRRTALAEYAVMALTAAVGVVGASLPPALQVLVVAAVIVVLSIAGVFIDRAWRRHEAGGGTSR